MVKAYKNSVIEVWGRDYINFVNDRYLEDRNAEILQIERGSDKDDYIVEFIRHEPEETTKKEG